MLFLSFPPTEICSFRNSHSQTLKIKEVVEKKDPGSKIICNRDPDTLMSTLYVE